MTVAEFAKRIKSIDLIEIAIEAFDAVDNDYIGFIQHQILSGKRGDDSDIEPEYASLTYALRKSQVGGRRLLTPNLYDTGDFFNSMIAGTVANEFVLDATDEKTQDLLAKYDKNNTLFSLSTKNKELFRRVLLSKMAEIIKRKL